MPGQSPRHTARDATFDRLRLDCVPGFFDAGEIDKAKATLIACLKSTDPRVRQKAAATALNHNLDLWKHQNPATQVLDVTHHVPNKIEVEFITAGKVSAKVSDVKNSA